MSNKFFSLFLTATLALSACGTLEVTMDQSQTPTAPTIDPTKIALEGEATAMRNFLTQQAATLWPPAQPPPTVTALFSPTSGPIQVDTPDVQAYISGEPVRVGYVRIPGVADAGLYFLDAGSTVSLTWNNPPLNAARYDFTMRDASDLVIVIGTDIDPTDGISVQWLVSANLSGFEVGAIAYSSNGQADYLAYGGTVYSNEGPPQNICTLDVRGNGAFEVYPEPSLSSQSFAYLVMGRYAEVYEYIEGGWYRIDASKAWVNQISKALDNQTRQPATGTGWVFDENHGFRLFGPCDQFG